jgi:hypothetical protein
VLPAIDFKNIRLARVRFEFETPGLNFKPMAPPKRKCLFSDILKREYPCLISDETDVNRVRYTLCKSIFSISRGGRDGIEKRICANKHKESLAAKASSKKKLFFCGKKHWR